MDFMGYTNEGFVVAGAARAVGTTAFLHGPLLVD
jgi:hypothetical protein